MGEQAKAPGLKWMRRKGGLVPYWVAPEKVAKAGYPVRTVNLSALADSPAALIARCHRLQAEMAAWLSPVAQDRYSFDGSFRALFNIYQTHEDSPYRALKGHSRELYDTYLPRLTDSIGSRQITSITGLDIKRWFAAWREPATPTGPERLARARVILAVLKAALSFGITANFTGCPQLREMVAAQRFESLQPRRSVVTAEMVDTMRNAAHAAGFHSAAFAFALQFETTMRQWDIVGRWVDLAEPGTSSVLLGKRKWLGPTWASIGKDLVFTVQPSKTERTTGAEVQVDLKLCPMVMDEICSIPVEKRAGPLIIDERTGVPFAKHGLALVWRRMARTAGVPDAIWNRDLRAGGITEGRKAGVAVEDLSKAAGHKGTKTTSRVYDRDVLAAARRAATQRSAFRTNPKRES